MCVTGVTHSRHRDASVDRICLARQRDAIVLTESAGQVHYELELVS